MQCKHIVYNLIRTNLSELNQLNHIITKAVEVLNRAAHALQPVRYTRLRSHVIDHLHICRASFQKTQLSLDRLMFRRPTL